MYNVNIFEIWRLFQREWMYMSLKFGSPDYFVSNVVNCFRQFRNIFLRRRLFQEDNLDQFSETSLTKTITFIH